MQDDLLVVSSTLARGPAGAHRELFVRDGTALVDLQRLADSPPYHVASIVTAAHALCRLPQPTYATQRREHIMVLL